MSAQTDLVDRNLAAYGAVDLDALAATLSERVVMGALNGKVFAEGRAAAREAYARTIEAYPMSGTTRLARAEIGAAVIDLERSARKDGRVRDVMTVYTIEAGAIARITTAVAAGPPDAGDLAVIEAQLDAYNAQNMEAMMATYAKDAAIAHLNGAVTEAGAGAIRHRYANLFQKYPENRALSLARFGAGAMILDHERVIRAPGGETFEAGALYTMAGGLIARVDFIR